MSKNNELLTIINIEEILAEKNHEDHEKWIHLLQQHPADIASLIEKLDPELQIALINKLPDPICSNVFNKLSEPLQVKVLFDLNPDKGTGILHNMPVDKLTDLFELLPDAETKKYLRQLQTKQRKQVISLLNFDPKSAGGIMNTDILALHTDYTIKKCITLLQKIQPQRERNEKIYITDFQDKLVGHIHIEDLVLNKPEAILKNLLHNNELVVTADEDQERVAKKMKRYDLLSAPVTDKNNTFLGVITADDVFDILEQESSEDVYRISGVSPTKHTYFQNSLSELIWQRSPWLITLLLFQSVSGFIMDNYSEMISKFSTLSLFITMLIGTGGNAGNQTGAVVIRGLATGEINRENGIRMLFRELQVSIVMSIILSIVAFARVWLTHSDLLIAAAISVSLFLIIIISILMGAFLPLLLDRLNFDPANSAQPFLATLVDIIGIFVYCAIASKILGF